jgi:hypothetical protein
MGLELLVLSVNFFDLCLVPGAQGVNLFVFESKNGVSTSAEGIELFETNCLVFNQIGTLDKFKKVDEKTVYLPGYKTVDMAVIGKSLYLGAISNNKLGLGLAKWALKENGPIAISANPQFVTAFTLSDEQAERVALDPAEGWSTMELPPEKWQFNSSIFPGQDKIMAVLNTALADALLLEYSEKENSWREIANIPCALEPKYIELGGRRLLAFRKPVSRWVVKSQSANYSISALQEGLLLDFVELDSTGKVLAQSKVKKPFGTDSTYIFDFASDGKGRLATATVTGPKDKPLVAINVSDDFGESWQKKGVVFLDDIPERLSLCITPEEAVVGMAFRVIDGYQIAVEQFPLKKD